MRETLKYNIYCYVHFPPFTSFDTDEWSMEDKILFEQAYSSHGKSFKRIQQTVCESNRCLQEQPHHILFWLFMDHR